MSFTEFSHKYCVYPPCEHFWYLMMWIIPLMIVIVFVAVFYKKYNNSYIPE